MKTGDGETHREFESHTLRQEMPSPYGGGISYSVRFEGSNAMRTSIAADGLTEANNYFRIMRKCKRSSTLRQEMPSPYGGGISCSVRFEGSSATRFEYRTLYTKIILCYNTTNGAEGE